MPASVEELMALLDLEVIEDNLFRGRQPDIHHIKRRDTGAQRDTIGHGAGSTSASSRRNNSRGEPSSCALPCARLK